jgi:hypothetical protein
VAEAAVVGKPHEIKGEAIFAYVVCRGVRPSGRDTHSLTSELRAWVGEALGAIAKPDEIRFADNLPKTRSGKIMRRLLRALARGEEISQDISTLENPAIIDQLRGVEPTAARAARAKKPRAARRQRPAARRKHTARKSVPRKSKSKSKSKSPSKPRVVRQAARKSAVRKPRGRKPARKR